MMRDWFGPGELPGGTGPYPKPITDISTYQKIWLAARKLETECTETRAPGWAVLGETGPMSLTSNTLQGN